MGNTHTYPATLFDDLLSILREEKQIYQFMARLVLDKQRAIVNGRIEQLNSIVDSEQNVIRNARKQEKKRTDLVEQICRQMGIRPPEIGLKELILKMPDIYAVKFLRLRNQLHESIQDITNRNRENGFLLNSSLNHVRGMVRIFLRNEKNAPNLYDGTGQLTSPDVNRKMLDCQI